jgi:DNA-binding FadR family transcriptional regulator
MSVCGLDRGYPELVYEIRRLIVERATQVKRSAKMHRRICRAIRARDPEQARRESEHLDIARQAQAGEEQEERRRARGRRVRPR